VISVQQALEIQDIALQQFEQIIIWLKENTKLIS